MVSFKTKGGVTISYPGNIKDRRVEQAIREIKISDIKKELLKELKNRMPNAYKKAKGGAIKKKTRKSKP